MLIIKHFLILAFAITASSGDLISCGVNDRPSGLMFGGINSTRGNWPWLVALFLVDQNEFFCGSTLISRRHLLTAAHCIQQKFNSRITRPSEIVAYLGRHDITKAFERGSQIGYPVKILIHDDWSYETERYDADIALIFLENDVTFNTYISPICVGSMDKLTGRNGTIGQTSQDQVGKVSKTPKHAELQMVSNEKCFLDHPTTLTFMSSYRTFCAKGADGVGPCLGDSGGGFLLKHGSKWFIRGIISASVVNDFRCDITQHAVFTSIFDYIDWITEKTGVKLATFDLSSLEIITRSMWRALPPKPAILYLNPPSKRIMISHTVTEECHNQQVCVEILQSIQRNHQNIGYNDIYCNFFIGGDGLVLEGRGWTIRGEHTVGQLSHNEAICVAFIGNFQDHPPRQSQIDALFKLIDDGVSTSMLDSDYVINAQRDFHPSLSPGDAFYNIMKTWPKFSNKS